MERRQPGVSLTGAAHVWLWFRALTIAITFFRFSWLNNFISSNTSLYSTGWSLPSQKIRLEWRRDTHRYRKTPALMENHFYFPMNWYIRDSGQWKDSYPWQRHLFLFVILLNADKTNLQTERPPFYSIVSHKAVNYIWYDYIFRLSCLIVLDIIKLSYDIFRYEGGSKWQG